MWMLFCFSSRRRHTSCALVTGVQTCALPISTTSLADLGDCDLVIEAATEKEAVKREIFKSLIPHLRDDALLATNTSSISITRLAAATDRPTRLMGMPFMNPVPVMPLVELIRGHATADAPCQAGRKP